MAGETSGSVQSKPDEISPAGVRTQAEDDAAIEEARHEGYEEGYAEGAADQAGWAQDTARAVVAWLAKHGDNFDPDHPDGITTDVVIQALYDAKRASHAQGLGDAQTASPALYEALKEAAHWLEWCINEHYAPDSSQEQAALKQARAALSSASPTSLKGVGDV